ncbi:MAG: AsmA-like C-terminal region-containing protein [Verrucomicrobia bacterium]|nr:AsmA-like C-terminal region-containing protein [Verrucomicrobiota bacterium]
MDRHKVLVNEATALNPDGQEPFGGYVQYFDPLDFRIFARGTIHPEILDPLLDEWWANLWENMSLEGPPAYGDVDVFGRWRETELVQARVYAIGSNALYRGQQVKEVSLDLHHKRGFVDISRLNALAGAGGEFSGSMVWVFPVDREAPMHSIFDLTSTVPLPVLLTALGQEPAAFSWLNPTDPPLVHLGGRRLEPREMAGETIAVATPPVQNVRISGNSGPGLLDTIPFDSMQLDLQLDGGALQSRDIQLGLFGGTVAANLSVQDYLDERSPLDIKLTAVGLDYGAVAVWLGGNENTGTLSFEAMLAGDRSGPDSLSGNASVIVAEADFGRIRLLGPMSRLLDAIGLNFSSFALNKATATVIVAEGRRIEVPDLRIQGPSANIQGQGAVFLATRNLDFDVRVFLLDPPSFGCVPWSVGASAPIPRPRTQGERRHRQSQLALSQQPAQLSVARD